MRRAPHAREKLVVRHEPTAREKELLEQPVLEPRQRHAVTRDRELARLQIEHDLAAYVQPSFGCPSRPAHRELETRDELSRRMWRCDRVVSAGRQGRDDGVLARSGGEHDERRGRRRAKARREGLVVPDPRARLGRRGLDDELRNAGVEHLQRLVGRPCGLYEESVRLEESTEPTPLPAIGGGEKEPWTDGHERIADRGRIATGAESSERCPAIAHFATNSTAVAVTPRSALAGARRHRYGHALPGPEARAQNTACDFAAVVMSSPIP